MISVMRHANSMAQDPYLEALRAEQVLNDHLVNSIVIHTVWSG